MDYGEILQGVLLYIDDHIHDKLTADELAAQAGFSTFHFCKVFLWGTGYSIMDYVRNRRLAYATAELSSGRRIMDIAMDYGFETHSGFSKAFRRRFGCSPEVYRLHAHFTVPSRPSLANMRKYSLGGIVMEPRFVERPATKLIGYVLRTRNTNGENSVEIPKFWGEYMTGGRMEKLHAEPMLKIHAEYGACFPVDAQTGEMDYMIGVEMNEGELPAGYEVREIPAAMYAVFTTPPADRAGFTAAIQGTWGYIYNEWFQSSGYEYAQGGVDYELYGEGSMGDSGLTCDIYIPVTRKA